MRAEGRIETKRRMVYTLPLPCYWADVNAVFAVIRQALADKRVFDDTVTVESVDDEQLRISYAVEASDV